MAEIVQPAASQEAVAASVNALQTTSTNPSGAVAIDQAKATFANIGDLRTKYPEIYNAFLMAFANRLRSDQERSNQRIINALREQRSRNGG